MLAWFKKKFGKQPVEPETVQVEEIPEAVAVGPKAESVADVPQESECATSADVGLQSAPEPTSATTEPQLETTADETVELEESEPVVVAPQPEPIGSEEDAAAVVVAEEPATELVEEEPLPLEALPAVETECAQPPQADAVFAVAEAEVTPDLVDEILPAEQEAPARASLPSEALAEDVPAVETIVEVADGTEVAEAPIEEEPHAEVIPAAPLAGTNQEKPASKSLFGRLRERLGKTRDALVYRLDRLFLGKKEIDQELFEQLEEILITSDLGVTTTLDLLDRARKKVKRDLLSEPQALKAIIREEILGYIQGSEQPAELVMPEEGPFVIMVVGVNGVGKTTSIGKIAAKFSRSGQSVLLVAGDTFRAAAINQLRIWGERVGVEVIAQKPGADPSSVVFDGLEYGVAHHYDVILIDTAGRLHTSVNLMEELKKIRRVIAKKLPGAPHEVMLVLDATTGQNGIAQAKMFHETVGVTGLTLTKLDGTAKGGIVANVCRETGIPVRFIGIGEQIDDLRDFDAREFVDALFAESEH
jgi:fused signal recognition particle receptor